MSPTLQVASPTCDKIFMWAIYNSYVIKNILKPSEIVGKRTLTFHMYVEKLCNELVAPQREH